MSDVIWAAAIAVSGSTLTGVIALLGTRHSAEETTRREIVRLDREHREDDRRVRRDAYANFMATIEELDAMISVYTRPPTMEQWQAWLWKFRTAGVAVRLVETPIVNKARIDVKAILDELPDEVMERVERGASMQDALGIPYVARLERMRIAGQALGQAMHDDLGFPDDTLAARTQNVPR